MPYLNLKKPVYKLSGSVLKPALQKAETAWKTEKNALSKKEGISIALRFEKMIKAPIDSMLMVIKIMFLSVLITSLNLLELVISLSIN